MPSVLLRFVIILLLLGVAVPGQADPKIPASPVVVPSEMCGEYFLVPITLAPRDDRPAERTLWFIYDTGASISHVDPSSVARASGVKVKPGQWAVIRDASAGPVKFNKLRAKVNNLDHLSRALGREIDGILAYDAFKGFLLTLDYQHYEMRLTKGQLPKPDGQLVFNAKGPDDRPWLEIQFPNRKQRMLIDSGAGTSGLVLNKLDRYETTAEPVVSGASFRLKKIEMRSSARAVGDAHIGPHVLVQPTLESTPGFELIGGKVMRHFNWTFDLKKERVRIERYEPETPITFDAVITHGMVLQLHKKGFRIKSIIANTPAAKADLRDGDVVTHWNGELVGERGCREEAADEQLLTVKLLRGEAELEVEIFLFPLVE